jgi:hypothetical protein
MNCDMRRLEVDSMLDRMRKWRAVFGTDCIRIAMCIRSVFRRSEAFARTAMGA